MIASPTITSKPHLWTVGLDLLWQKLWNRELKVKPPLDETPTQKKQRQAAARKEARNRPFEQKVLLQVGRSTHFG